MNDTVDIIYEDVIDADDFIFYDDYGRGLRGKDDMLLIEFIRGISAILLRIGYILVQTGCIPVENVYVILYHNIIEIAMATLSFGTFGIFVSYGFSVDRYKTYWQEWDKNIVTRSATGSCAALVGTAEMSTFLVGRISTRGLVLLVILYCALFQPFLMYLVWTPKGLMKEFHVRMRNPGFTLVAYIPSTIIGLVGALFLGRRVMRIRDVDEFSFGKEHAIGTMLGYFMIIMGYTILGLPVEESQMALPAKVMEAVARMLYNNSMAVGTGVVTISFLYFVSYREIHKYWIILRCMQGGVAAMMTISAATDYTGLWNVFAMSVLGATLFFLTALALHNTALEDCCNMTASHLICGVLGALTWPLFEGLFDKNILWQLLYTLAILALTTLFAVILFVIMNATGLLRNDYEVVNNRRARNILSHLPDKGYLERLFMIIEDKTPHIIPGSYRNRYIPDDKNIAFAK